MTKTHIVMKFRKWYYPNVLKLDCTPTFGFAIKLNNGLYLFCFSFVGLKRQKSIHPYANKCYFTISVSRKRLTFRIGTQNKTWFWIRCCEFHDFTNRIKNRNEYIQF